MFERQAIFLQKSLAKNNKNTLLMTQGNVWKLLVTALINLIIAFAQGAAVGAGVVVSQYIGADKKDKIKISVHTSICISIILGLILSLLGIFASPSLLIMMKTEISPSITMSATKRAFTSAIATMRRVTRIRSSSRATQAITATMIL